MKKIIQHIYSAIYFADIRTDILKIQQLSKLSLAGFFIITFSLATIATGQASEVTSAGVIPVAQEDRLVNQYISRSAYMQVGAQQNTTTSNSWVSTTRRLSRGFSGGHTGLDVDGEFGDPIYAMSNGVVRDVTTTGPYGNKVVIEHSNGLVTLSAHLQKIYVQPGQAVSAGEAIGEMGSTGASTGSHLHFEVFRDGQLVDPATFSYL